VAEGLLAALSEVLSAAPGAVERVAISTTLVTNAVASGQLPEVVIYALPGPGLDCRKAFPVPPVLVAGYTDHRGVEIAALGQAEALSAHPPQGKLVVVSGKFSVRNPGAELRLAAKLSASGARLVVTGQSMSGQLGFARRTNSAYYTAATAELCGTFFAKVRGGLARHGIDAPLYVLKADGGTMPEAMAQEHTVETYFTGPAASAIGIKALASPAQRAISLDIGGTTTDIAFWENGEPLFGKRGAKINGYPTAVRALQLSSLPVGGDSHIQRAGDGFSIGPERLGPAMALGGPAPTLADAFLTLGLDDFGDREKARAAIASLAKPGEGAAIIAREILRLAAELIAGRIKEMIEDYALQPVYRVEDVLGARPFAPELIIGVGGAARGLAFCAMAYYGKCRGRERGLNRICITMWWRLSLHYLDSRWDG
jgi:N-methylhydantoinase A/oxoprolinase/acetone carboxylase beta subunit